MKLMTRILAALVGCMAVISTPAFADDSEVFTSASQTAGVRPNILFVIDTSYSMNTLVNTYDPAVKYAGPCSTDRIYWSTQNNKTPPDCATTTQWISVDNNRCRTAFVGFDDGWWNGKAFMLIKQDTSNKNIDPTKWGPPVAGKDWKIECQSDVGLKHGDLPGSTNSTSTNYIPKNGNSGSSDSDRWGAQTCKNGKCNDPAGVVTDWNTSISLYSGNYANFFKDPSGNSAVKSRFQIVHDVAKNLIQTLSGVNLGLMRYSSGNEGGMVTYPVSELTDAARTAMIDQLDTNYEPKSVQYTPLSETYYEAYLYLTGGKVKYGLNSKTDNGNFPSVSTSRLAGDQTKYDSPMDFSCQSTYIVYLTDGLPTKDEDANTLIDGLSKGIGDTGCDAHVPGYDKDWPDDGKCTMALARYMSNSQPKPLADTTKVKNFDLMGTVAGKQTVQTYVIGFGDDVAASQDFLDAWAFNGGTNQAYTQSDAAGLKATLEDIISKVQAAADTTFVAPAVSVNAFNRAQTLNELYVSVFAPSKTMHWPGNLKKYRIWNREVYGIDSAAPAVDSSGFFAKGAQSLNSKDVDGPFTTVGGAAAQITDAGTSRKLYTYTGSSKNLTDTSNLFTEANTALTTTLLNVADATERSRVIQYTRGADLKDEVKDDAYHHKMGDPMHARPAILIHGGTDDAPQGTVFVPTNDGVLHAFDMAHVPGTDNADGVVSYKPMPERWAFIPKEMLPRQKLLFDDAPRSNHSYALDADVKVLKLDVDQNGIINDNDRAYIFFSTGRGGKGIYALDVTNVEEPKFMWYIDDLSTGFNTLGRTWSVPQVGRVKIAGSGQSKQNFVLIFGGGYDTQNDLQPTTYTYKEDTVGNSIYIVDAETGKLLWSAGRTGSSFNFLSDKMTHSFAANVTAIDTDADLFIDRIYAADMDAKVWRFDLANGKDANSLATGGVIASLGNGALAAGSRNFANNRRFYSAPDVTSMTQKGSLPYFNIAIGSGYRGHPLSKLTNANERFYGIRDYLPYTARDQASYTDAAIVTEADSKLIDVTDMSKNVTDADKGWRLDLQQGSWVGEKNLSESVTAAGVVLFSTFTPLDPDPNDPCLARVQNRVYGVYASNGWAFTRWNTTGTGQLKPSDRYTDTTNKGIASSPQVLVDPAGGKTGICLGGTVNTLKKCVDIGSAIRSYWEHK